MGKKYDIIWHKSVDSTNNMARMTLGGIDKMSVIAAEFQTAGRGQKGNVWTSEEGMNLTFSAAVRFGKGMFPEIAATEQFAVSECASVAVADFLCGKGIPVSIKWPNDIYAGDRKICGILIENIVRGGRLDASIIGIGLNVNQTIFPPELPNPTSMQIETGQEYRTDAALEELAALLCDALSGCADESGTSSLRQKYLSLLYRKDSLHNYIDCASGKVIQGIIRGISPAACLRLEIPGEGIREFAFKEISYVI